MKDGKVFGILKIVFKKLLPLLFGLLLLFQSTASAEEEENSSLLPAPILNFKLVCKEQPKGVFSWNQISGANIYQLYTIKGQNFTPVAFSGTEATVNLSTNEDYKYTVEAMQKDNGKIVKEGKWSNEVFIKGEEIAKKCGLSKGEEKEEARNENAKTSDVIEGGKEEKEGQEKIHLVEKVIEKEASGNGKTSELEQKVGQLSKELEQTKQRQNALEQIVNNLLSFIKSIFKLSF